MCEAGQDSHRDIAASTWCLRRWSRPATKFCGRKATWEYRGCSSGCDDGTHRHSERGIHHLLSGLAETLATVSWLRMELLRRGQEALVARLNFVFFTDSVSDLYGERMYMQDISFPLTFIVPCIVNVFLSITNKMQRYIILFIIVSAVHVSSGFPPIIRSSNLYMQHRVFFKLVCC
jgi:hypothetical protein